MVNIYMYSPIKANMLSSHVKENIEYTKGVIRNRKSTIKKTDTARLLLHINEKFTMENK